MLLFTIAVPRTVSSKRGEKGQEPFTLGRLPFTAGTGRSACVTLRNVVHPGHVVGEEAKEPGSEVSVPGFPSRVF